MSKKGMDRLLEDVLKPSEYSLKDLEKISEALAVLYFYDLADKDLYIEVLKYIKLKKGAIK